jgi:glycosyltransferase involved in cell wall biosynthesis
MRLTGKKRPEPLVRLVAALRDALAPAGVRVRLTLAGEGSERPALEALVRRLALDDVVRLPGWRTRAELRTLYHAADVFVLPTREEAFGIAALEARAAGLPVVAWRGTGVADFVRDGVHGLLCASDAEMTDRLAALGREPQQLAALAAHGRADPPAAYDWREVVRRHEAVYAAAGAVDHGARDGVARTAVR